MKTSPLKPIYANDIVVGMNQLRIRDGRFKSPFSEARLRRLVNHIRTWGILPLIADKRGYYVSDDINDIEAQIKSLEERIAGMESAKRGMMNYRSQLLHTKEGADPFGIDWSKK